MSTPPPSPPPPMPTSEKKGLSGLAWTGIGCGVIGLIVLAFAIGGGILAYNKIKEFASNPEKVAAELIIGTHPELQKISSDDAKGEITFRTKAGETYTVSYKDITEGKFSFKDASGVETRVGGSSDIADVPAWVPRVPEMTTDLSVFNTSTSGKSSGLYTVKSTASLVVIEAHFETEAKKAGLGNSTRRSTSLGGTNTIILSYTDGPRRIEVNASKDVADPASVTVSYQDQ